MCIRGGNLIFTAQLNTPVSVFPQLIIQCELTEVFPEHLGHGHSSGPGYYLRKILA
jgi:hypothetical protein